MKVIPEMLHAHFDIYVFITIMIKLLKKGIVIFYITKTLNLY